MTGAERIAAERLRQVEQEGWTPEHDREGHHPWMMLDAARCYAQLSETRLIRARGVPLGWPWERRWWKPKDRLRDLERAGALAQAVLDCRDERDGQVGSRLPSALFSDAVALREWCAVEIDRLLGAGAATMIDYPPAWFGIEEEPPEDGTCSCCGEDIECCLELGCGNAPVARGYRARITELEAVVSDLQERLAAERERADRAEARASVAGWSA